MRTIAVYGTLRQGGYNHPLLKGAVLRGRVHLVGWLYEGPGYPVFVPDPAGVEIYFEVYEVDNSTYLRLDWMESGAGYQNYQCEFNGDPCTFWAVDQYTGKQHFKYNPATNTYD